MPKPALSTPTTRTVPRTAWPKGVSGNPKGKAPGTRNHATLEVAAVAHRLVTDVVYVRNLLARLRAGTAGAIEVLLWHYAFGKPTELHAVHVATSDDGWRELLTARLEAVVANHTALDS